MVGGLRCVVIHVKCDPNRLRGYGAVGVENGPFLLLWPMAYTTACTTVQAVITLITLSTPLPLHRCYPLGEFEQATVSLSKIVRHP